MRFNEVFIDAGRLRPIWRFFVSVVLLFLAFMVVGKLLPWVLGIGKAQPGFLVAAFWQSLIGMIAVLASYKLMTAVFDRRALGSMGLAFHSRWWRELLRGLVVGAAMLFVAIVLEVLCGFARYTFTPHPALGAGCLTLLVFALAAVNEEAIFRGYPFQRLAESITPVGAVAVTCLFFGFAHLANPHRTWISTLNTALVGVPFCIAYLRTRALWLPIGIHFIWNFLLGFFLGMPVSGLTVPASVLRARVSGPVWMTGGDYGPEGGLLALAAILAGTVYLSFAKSIYTTEEMKALVSGASQGPEPHITIFSVPPKEETRGD